MADERERTTLRAWRVVLAVLAGAVFAYVAGGLALMALVSSWDPPGPDVDLTPGRFDLTTDMPTLGWGALTVLTLAAGTATVLFLVRPQRTGRKFLVLGAVGVLAIAVAVITGSAVFSTTA
ncbi:hypothetical protein [Georgenia ruanii]|uniref:hypothetical protein n=1 Tax=Georgenia ruanii TaxID=348442 RepID=UPI0012657BBA|nr:hypothetical protein [Georgenia ruanii]